MHFEQLTKLALIERQLVNAFAANVKFTPVPGQGLWPRALAEISCKNYNAKPSRLGSLKQASGKVARSRPNKRDKRNPVTVRVFDAAQVAALNDEYVALINAMTMQRNRALLIGEVRR